MNVFDNPSQIGKWGSINSRISRLLTNYKEGDEVDIILQVKNKYTQINYPYDELPETLDDILKEFPESVDLEYSIYENGKSVGQIGYLKKFEDVKEEIEKPGEISNTPQLPPKAETKKESESGQTVIIDVNQLFEKYSSSLQSVASQNNKPEPVRQENPNSDLIESLRQQISDLKQIHSQQVAELKDLLKEAKEEVKLANSQLFTLQMENTRLSITAAQGVNPQSVDDKVQEAIRAFERNQKKFSEQYEEKKKELDAIQNQITEAKIVARTKQIRTEDDTEINKAMADVMRSKLPQLIDKGLDLLSPTPNLAVASSTQTPAIV